MTFDERSTKLLRALVIAWDVDDGEEADDVLRACRRHLGLVLHDDQRSHEEQLAAILEADEEIARICREDDARRKRTKMHPSLHLLERCPNCGETTVLPTGVCVRCGTATVKIGEDGR